MCVNNEIKLFFLIKELAQISREIIFEGATCFQQPLGSIGAKLSVASSTAALSSSHVVVLAPTC